MAFGAVGAAFVELGLHDAGFNQGLSAADAKLQAFGGSAGKTMTGFQKVSQAAFLGASVAAVAFTAASVKAYAQHQAALTQLQNIISRTPTLVGASTAAFDAQAKALADLTGANRDEIISADTVLARFGLTADQITKMIPLIVDYAKATGQDIPAAAAGVGKALLGNTRALKTVGIEFKATGDRAKDVGTIMNDLQGKVGGVGKAFGQTAQGQIARFNAGMHDLEIELGQVVLPILTGLVKGAGAVLHVIDGLPGPVKVAAASFVGLAIAIRGVQAVGGFFAKAFGGIKKSIGEASVSKDAFAKNVTGTLVPAAEAGATTLGVLADAAVAVAVPLAGAAAVAIVAAHGAKQLDQGVQGDIATVKQWGTTTAQGKAAMERLNATLNMTRRTFHGVSIDSGHAGSSVQAAMAKAASYTDGFGASVGHATGEVARLNAVINAIPRHVQTDYYFIIHGQPGGVQGRFAHGAVFKGYAGGADFMGPGGPFRAGEGGYATPVGNGGEIVGQSGVQPLDFNSTDKIAGALARRLGGGGGASVTVDLRGSIIAGKSARQFAEEIAPEISRAQQKRVNAMRV